jgi:hypothetical protein
MDEESRRVRISQNVFDQPVTPVAVRVCQLVKKSPTFGHLNFVMEITLFFMAKGFAIRDEKLEVPGVGRVNRGAKNLVDDAVADGEPKSAADVVGSSDTLLVGMGPARLDSWSSESRSASREVCCDHGDINLMVHGKSSFFC